MPVPALLPRIAIAGLSGDSGKTLVSLALLMAFRRVGKMVRAFKKGPDYIDAAWLGWAAGAPATNLDTYMLDVPAVLALFAEKAIPDGLNVIEGNRGFYDGMDASGSRSSAELAKTLRCPVLLVVNATKVTRTAAASVLGCQTLDPTAAIAGVILNQVAGIRHREIVRESIESICGIPVLGTIPRAGSSQLLPARHLGLVTPAEHPHIRELGDHILALTEGRLDLERILVIAQNAGILSAPSAPQAGLPDAQGLRIGVVQDSVCNFYYPENLEALSATGATLVQLSVLTSREIPDNLAALYIGGGFPETYGAAIAANRPFLESLRKSAEGGLPIYAECGGLMLLSRSILWQGDTHLMAGFLPLEIQMHAAPQGHGYTELVVDRPNPFYPQGLSIRGHEFHYSGPGAGSSLAGTVCAVRRGTGCGDGRDGIVQANTWASYTHVHARGCPEWARGLLRLARARSYG